MLTNEIAACCKELKLSRNMVEMADRVQADSHPEYLCSGQGKTDSQSRVYS